MSDVFLRQGRINGHLIFQPYYPSSQDLFQPPRNIWIVSNLNATLAWDIVIYFDQPKQIYTKCVPG